MKTLLLTFAVFSSFLFDPQDYTLTTHPMYSKIWTKEYEIVKNSNGGYDTTSYIKPKNGGRFKVLSSVELDSIRSSIDFDHIKDSLIFYLNDFRSDYKIHSVTENFELVQNSFYHANELMKSKQLYHSKNSSKRFEEAVVFVPFTLFSRVQKSDGPIESLISESCFDIFIGSPAHTSVLLKEDTLRTFGVGISVSFSGFYVVVQSIVE